ncbi:MAG: hypothetical protein KA149_00135 [Chitinophagales bacterium]|nr:hypothetical protein [Chitinophagales bacterium]
MILIGKTGGVSKRVIKMYNQNRSYELTYAELKTIRGFEGVSEDEARELIFQLKEISLILYETFMSREQRKGKSKKTYSTLKPDNYENRT